MNRITKLFEENRSGILNIYCTAGYPHKDSISAVLEALQQSGVDMVEIGMPYSDPIADGPVIQQSNMTALSNGMTISLLFEQLKDCRKYFHLPLILMGYLNPVLQFGLDRFCRMASEAGVDGIILPDLPIREYQQEFARYFDDAGLEFIFLVTPETSESRIRLIDSLSKGFIYAVSSSATTGGETDLSSQDKYLSRLAEMQLVNPVLTGFGIKDRETFEHASRHTNGAIIGSAYIKALSAGEDIKEVTGKFISGIRPLGKPAERV